MDPDFDKVYEKFTAQVRVLQQVRADALNCSSNLVRLFQSLAALTRSARGGIANEGDGLIGKTADVVVAEQEALLQKDCSAAESSFKSSVLSPLEDELLRARDALFRMEIRKRLHQEIESLRPRMSNPQVQQYVRERRTEYEASTRGLRDTMTTLLPRQKELAPILLNEIVAFQMKFYEDAAARLRKIFQKQNSTAEAVPATNEDNVPSIPDRNPPGENSLDDPIMRWSVENAATSYGGLAETTVPMEQDTFVVQVKATSIPSSSVSGSTHESEAFSVERQIREQLKAKQEQEIKKRAEEKLEEVRERAQKFEQEMDEVAGAKELVKPRVDMWTNAEQLRGNLVALLIGLDGLFPPSWNWKPVTSEDLAKSARVKLHYNKAILLVHPDKLVGKDAESKALGELVFEELQNAWTVYQAHQEGQPPPPGSVGPKQPNFGQHNMNNDAAFDQGSANIATNQTPMNMYNMSGGASMPQNVHMNPMGYGGYNNAGGYGAMYQNYSGTNMPYNMNYGMMGNAGTVPNQQMNAQLNPQMDSQMNSQMYSRMNPQSNVYGNRQQSDNSQSQWQRRQ
eukprot:Plantae.Rhodophyta-Purpureofilum_apyrenoidigerum.ctg709.p1 GENE.Plantae.Rhodophyta-Purpureofilum_apyrenoidigerum.ctg709~~Plantae.Rhodophyta-Purpureofilum_apyrenoidigerum.ctg709.p1  ORF type:complete len:568 (-),score=122.38 Plantae.Rhodophyta-Purpureofilum_apyrenoidigerum.ctg709:254-1957(-)